jgi:hypothetical protein
MRIRLVQRKTAREFNGATRALSRDALTALESKARRARGALPIFTCTNFNNSCALLDSFIGQASREFQYSVGFS